MSIEKILGEIERQIDELHRTGLEPGVVQIGREEDLLLQLALGPAVNTVVFRESSHKLLPTADCGQGSALARRADVVLRVERLRESSHLRVRRA